MKEDAKVRTVVMETLAAGAVLLGEKIEATKAELAMAAALLIAVSVNAPERLTADQLVALTQALSETAATMLVPMGTVQ